MTVTASQQTKFEAFVTDFKTWFYPTKTRQWVIDYIVLHKGITASDF